MRTGNASPCWFVAVAALHPVTARLATGIIGLLLLIPAIPLQADTPPFVVAATARCGLPLEVDVEFDEYVDAVSAMDPFNYTVFQTSSNGAPSMRGEYVTDAAHNHRTFRVRFFPTSFVPDARSVLLVEYVADLAGTPVWPLFTVITPCPEPTLEIARAEYQCRITWPSNLDNFTLESAPDLAPETLWEPVDNSVSLVNGRFEVRIDPVEPRRVYRLRQK